MDLLKYVERQIDKIRQTKVRCDRAAEEARKKYAQEFHTLGGTIIQLSKEQIYANQELGESLIHELYAECDKEIEKIISETEEYLNAEKKKAIQEYAAAEPVPSDDDFKRIEQLKLEYGINDGVGVTSQFLTDMDFHIQNETVFAFAYYLLAKMSLVKNPENDSLLQNAYLKLFPTIQEKADRLKAVEDAINVFRSQVILYKMASNENISFAESVAMKVELESFGYYAGLSETTQA